MPIKRVVELRSSLRGFEQSTTRLLFSHFFDFFLYQGSNG